MTTELPSLKALQTFDAAARHLSFTKAADELGVSQGAVSAQIARLEAQLGTELFVRSTRRVRLNDKGVILARACRRGLESMARGVDMITEQEDSSVLTIAVTTYVTARWLSRRLNDFLAQYPDTTVRFQHSVNAPEFEISDVDLAIRWGDGGWTDSVSELWLPMARRLMCSPRLLEGPDAITSPQDLRHHTLLRDIPTMDLWDKWLTIAGVDLPGSHPSIVLPDPVVRVQAAIDGQGVILADDLVSEDVAAGRLVEPFDIEIKGYGYYLVRPANSEERAVARAFRKWIFSQSR